MSVGGCHYGTRPKSKIAHCPICNRRFRTVVRDSCDVMRDNEKLVKLGRGYSGEYKSDWHHHIPPHKPKVKKPRIWKRRD